MSEEQGKYVTETQEAMEMLGKGYGPAAEIHPTKNILALHDGGLAEYKVWGWVKISANFIKHIKKLKGAKLAIWQVVSLSIDVDGICNLSIHEIADLSGYSYAETSESLTELDEMGYLSIQRVSGKKSMYSPDFAARGQNSPTVTPHEKTRGQENNPPLPAGGHPSSPSLQKAPSCIKELKRVNTKKGDLVDGALFFGKQAIQRGEDKIEEVLQILERGLHVNISRTTQNQAVAKRLLKDARPLEKFLSWVMADEWRAAHAYLYADLEKVWRDFPQAFVTTSEPRPEHKKFTEVVEEIAAAVPNPFSKPESLKGI